MIKGLFRKKEYNASLEDVMQELKAIKSKYDIKRKDGTLCINDMRDEGNEMITSCRRAETLLQDKLKELQKMRESLQETVIDMEGKYGN